jgi:hypothetical protein
MALCPGLLTLEPLALPLEATLPGFLLAFLVVSGLGMGFSSVLLMHRGFPSEEAMTFFVNSSIFIGYRRL